MKATLLIPPRSNRAVGSRGGVGTSRHGGRSTSLVKGRAIVEVAACAVGSTSAGLAVCEVLS